MNMKVELLQPLEAETSPRTLRVEAEFSDTELSLLTCFVRYCMEFESIVTSLKYGASK